MDILTRQVLYYVVIVRTTRNAGLRREVRDLKEVAPEIDGKMICAFGSFGKRNSSGWWPEGEEKKELRERRRNKK
jgi:hypothetical protein